MLFICNIFNISNLVAKAPGLNLGKQLSNLLRNREVLNCNQHFVYFFLSQNNGLEKFMVPLTFQNKKNIYNTILLQVPE